MSIFTCCEREDETKYLHTCACPSATFSCESEEVRATLCGHSEYSGFASSPPLRYRVKTNTILNYTLSATCRFCSGEDPEYVEGIGSGNGSYTATHTYDTNTCSLSTVRTGSPTYTISGTLARCPEAIPYSIQTNIIPVSMSIISATLRYGEITTSTNPDNCGNSSEVDNSQTETLSVEDTDEDAVARETPTVGTSCSSLWETRSTGFSFTNRTSGYTIDCDDLVVGVEYDVKPIIRKRTAVIGSYGAWEDVTVTPVSFTATATTHTIDDGGNPIELDHIQGYEYQVTGVNIEKKA